MPPAIQTGLAAEWGAVIGRAVGPEEVEVVVEMVVAEEAEEEMVAEAVVAGDNYLSAGKAES